MLRALLLCLVLLGTQQAVAQEKVLRLFNWSNYMAPDLLKRFEAETGIHVTLDVYDSNETMLAKLQAGGGGYDIVVPTGPTLSTMIRTGLLTKIDAPTLPNFRNVRATFANPAFDPGRAYSVPYMYGITGIAYDAEKAPPGEVDDSWAVLLRPGPSVAGKIGMLNDVNEVFAAASYLLGQPVCPTSPAQGQAVLDLLLKQKPDVLVYSSDNTVGRIAGGETAMQMMWNGAFHRANARKASIRYVFPREGMTLWADSLVVPKGAPHLENAKVFLNWMMEPKNAAEASNFLGYNNAIEGSEAFLAESLRNDPAVNPPADKQALLHLNGACDPAARDIQERVWTRLRR